MSYCQKPEWGHHFSPGQHHKAKWQLDNPIITNYDTPDLVKCNNRKHQFTVSGVNYAVYSVQLANDAKDAAAYCASVGGAFGYIGSESLYNAIADNLKVWLAQDDCNGGGRTGWYTQVDGPDSNLCYRVTKYYGYDSNTYPCGWNDQLNDWGLLCSCPLGGCDDYTGGQYVPVEGSNKILQDQGETVRDYNGVSSFDSCRNKCENNPSCNSFTYCTGTDNCSLKSLVVLGTEPTTSSVGCTSYYRKSIKLDHGLNENGNIQHMYKDVSNGVNGFCRDSSGNKKILGDWNVDSSDKCRALCDSFFACAGFQFGRNDNPQDCNLYYEAEQTSASTSAWTPCNKKLDKLDHDGYTWRGKGYCRDANGQNHFLRKVMEITDEIQCAKECNQDPDCKGFALGNGTDVDRCNLYGSAVTNSGSEGIGGCWAKTD